MAAAGVNWVDRADLQRVAGMWLEAVTAVSRSRLRRERRQPDGTGGGARRGEPRLRRHHRAARASAAPGSTSPTRKDARRSTWAEGVFLATNSPMAKPSTIALLQRLLGTTSDRDAAPAHDRGLSSPLASSCHRDDGGARHAAGGRAQAAAASPRRSCRLRIRHSSSSTCVTLSQRPREGRGAVARRAGRRRRGRARRGVGEGRAQAAHRHDAARRRAEAAAPAARTAFAAALEASLDRAAARAARSRHAGAASPQPDGVRQRHPRSAGARRRRRRAAAAGRLGRRLRQHRRRARRVAGADRRVCGRRGADQPAGHRQSVDRPRPRRPTACPATCRRTRTSTACRWARAAASSSATRSRSMPSTTCRWGRPAAAGSADPPPAGPRTDDLYVTIDGVRVTLQGAGRHATARWRPARTRLPRRASSAATPAAPTASTTSRRARPASRRSRSPGPFNATGPGDTPSRRRLLVCTPAAAAEELPCARTILTALATRAYPPADRGREPRARHAARVLSRRPAAVVRVRHRARGGARPRRSAVPLPVRARAGAGRGGHGVPRHRPRAGVAAVVLPLEQHSRRRAAGRRRAGRAERPGHARAPGAAHAGRPRGRRAGDQLRGAVAVSARAAERAARFAGLRRQPPPVVPARDGAALPHRPARGPQHRRPAGRRLHVRRRAPRASTTAFPAFAARGRGAWRWPPDSPRRGLLGHGSILTVTSAANRTSPVQRGKWVLENVLGAPPPQPPPGVETNLEADAGTRQGDLAAPAHGAAPRQPGVRLVPLDHGPDRVRARELRPRRQVADDRRRARRSTPAGQLVDGTKLDGSESLRRALRRARRSCLPRWRPRSC